MKKESYIKNVIEMLRADFWDKLIVRILLGFFLGLIIAEKHFMSCYQKLDLYLHPTIDKFIQSTLSFDLILNGSIVDIFLAQVSVSFIVTSLFSFLGDTGKPVYWTNTKEYFLIEPEHLGMKDYVSYCFTTLFISLVALVFRGSFSLFFSFIANVIFLILLSFTLIRMNYERKFVKDKLELKYLAAPRRDKNLNPKKCKEDYIDNLVEESKRELENSGDSIYILENIRFLMNPEFRIDGYSDKAILDILLAFPYEKPQLFYQAAKETSYLMQSDTYIDNWTTIISSFLRGLIANTSSYIEIEKKLYEEFILKKMNDFLENNLSASNESFWGSYAHASELCI